MDCENFLSDALSRSQERFKKIVALIEEISADIIGLNEVTHSCLKFLLGNFSDIFLLKFYFTDADVTLSLLDDPTIRRDYFISENLISKKKSANLTLNDTDHWMGNILLSKYPMNELYNEFWREKS